MTDKRISYRRYEDRRVAMMLALHEILFDESPSKQRDALMLEAIVSNYHVDRAAVLEINRQEKSGVIAVRLGDWQTEQALLCVQGAGFEALLALHEHADGALTFESVRKPDFFDPAIWNDLWARGIAAPARALLSIAINPTSEIPRLLWLQQSQSSREWSSRDRDLAEEIADLLKRAIERGV